MKTFVLSLSSTDVFQILDALDRRAESYEYTARHLAGTHEDCDEFQLPEECATSTEASAIAKHFRDVGISIRGQIDNQ